MKEQIEYANSLIAQYQRETNNFSLDIRGMNYERLLEIKPVSREALSAIQLLMSVVHPRELPNVRRAYAYMSALRDFQAAAYAETLEKWKNETTRIEDWIKSRSNA